jgi:hypothetical protein
VPHAESFGEILEADAAELGGLAPVGGEEVTAEADATVDAEAGQIGGKGAEAAAIVGVAFTAYHFVDGIDADFDIAGTSPSFVEVDHMF